MKQKVWITQETAHDVRQAEQYGDVTFVTHLDFLSLAKSGHNDALALTLRQTAARVAPDDYIVMVGSPYVSALFCAMVYARLGHLKVLRWSNRDGVYYPLTLATPS